MEDKYVGDIGNYAKYALLGFLAKDGAALGIVWYRTRHEDKSYDGNSVQYLSSQQGAEELGECDFKLFTALRKIVESKDRRVVRIRNAEPFGRGKPTSTNVQ